jgi:hypothetical protein
MCFLFVSLIETNCFINGNKLFLLGKQNVSTCETSSETIVLEIFQSAFFAPNFWLFEGDILLSCIEQSNYTSRNEFIYNELQR